MWFLIAVYFYVIGGIVAGRAAYASGSARMTSVGAAVAWPAAPSKWLFNIIREAVG